MRKRCVICGNEFEPDMVFYFIDHSSRGYSTDICNKCYQKSKNAKK